MPQTSTRGEPAAGGVRTPARELSTSALVSELSHTWFALGTRALEIGPQCVAGDDAELQGLVGRYRALLTELRGRDVDVDQGVEPPREEGFRGGERAAPVDLVEQVRQLKEALVTRTVIGQAQGILIQQHKVTAEEAFRILVWSSEHRNLKLHDIAAELVLTGELVGQPQHALSRPDSEATVSASAGREQTTPPGSLYS